jgi:nicotinic acid mononucleotide adenylyltransferase
MFEIAKKAIESQDPNKKVVAGYISPLPDSEYMRKKLGNEAAKSKDRVEMVKLALKDSNWLDINLWQTEYKKAFPYDITGPNDIITNLSNYLNLKYKPLTKEIRKHSPDGVEVIFICGSDDAEKFIENRYTGKSGMISRGFKTVVIGRGSDD